MTIDRRTVLKTAGATAVALSAGTAQAASAAAGRGFPKGFLWGAATASYQVEGNNVASDLWLVEHVQPTLFQQPSGDAVNSFELWATDLDLVKSLNLNSYRFSIEWSRIEPEPGQFSRAMLDHYARIVDGCHARGIAPVVTFCHFTTPRWFAAQGGWTHPKSPELFARYCDQVARRIAPGIAYAITLNEPNMITVVGDVLPPPMMGLIDQMNQAAGRASGSDTFKNGMMLAAQDIAVAQDNMIAAHKAGRAAIKAVRADLPVGVSLTITDDQVVGDDATLRDRKRALYYGPWLEAAKGDDFIGVQNYARSQWTATGPLPAPQGAPMNQMGAEIYAPSLAGAVAYAHQATGSPVLISEHGVGTADDALRARFIPESLAELRKTMASGVPVLGYLHWSLVDNFEWIFGYSKQFGLCGVDRETFVRTPKPSAGVLAAIARANGL